MKKLKIIITDFCFKIKSFDSNDKTYFQFVL